MSFFPQYYFGETNWDQVEFQETYRGPVITFDIPWTTLWRMETVSTSFSTSKSGSASPNMLSAGIAGRLINYGDEPPDYWREDTHTRFIVPGAVGVQEYEVTVHIPPPSLNACLVFWNLEFHRSPFLILNSRFLLLIS